MLGNHSGGSAPTTRTPRYHTLHGPEPLTNQDAPTPMAPHDEANEDDGSHIPPQLRMRGGGGSQSAEIETGRKVSKPYPNAPLSSAAAKGGAGGTLVGAKRTTSKLVIVPTDTVSASEGASSAGTRSPAPRAAVGNSHSQLTPETPETPYLQRPVLTIFTTVGDDSEDGASPVSAEPVDNYPPPPQQRLTSDGNYHNHHRRHHSHHGHHNSALKATETSLSPLHHYSLFGNGLEPAPAAETGGCLSAVSSFPPVGSTHLSFADAPGYHLRPGLTPPESPSIPLVHVTGHNSSISNINNDGASASFFESPAPLPAAPTPSPSPLAAGTLLPQSNSFAGIPLSTPTSISGSTRVSATPVVPINPYNETATRRRVVSELQRHYGPDADKYIEEFDNTVAAAEAAAAAATTGSSVMSVTMGAAGAAAKNSKEAEKQRKQREKEEAKAKKSAVKPVDKKQQQQQQPTQPMTREQIIRVGAMRLSQRLSTLHLAVYRVKNDGNCQFRSIAYQLLGSEDYHDLIRAQVVSYMKRVRREKFDFYFASEAEATVYLDKLAKVGTWGDEMSLRGASDALYINIHVLSSVAKSCYSCYQPSEDAPPAPSFLVDIAKIKERRRRERQYKRWQQKSASHMSSFAVSRSPNASSISPATPANLHGVDLNPGHNRSNYKNIGSPGSLLIQQQQGSQSCPEDAYRPVPLLRPVTSMGGMGDHFDSNDTDKDDDDDDDDEELDANRIQQALQRKLEKKHIKASVPFFTPDGQLRHPRGGGVGGGNFAHSMTPMSSQFFSPQTPAQTLPTNFLSTSDAAGSNFTTGANQNSFQVTSCVSNTVAAALAPPAQNSPLLVPQRDVKYTPTISARRKADSNSTNVNHAGTLSPTTCGKLSKRASTATTASATPAAAAAGPVGVVKPNVTADCVGDCNISSRTVVDLSHFGVTANDAVNITKYQTLRRPPSRLLRPAVETSLSPQGQPPAHRPQQQEHGSLDVHEGGASPQVSFTNAQSFPIFPTVGGGNVMLLASSPTRSKSGNKALLQAGQQQQQQGRRRSTGREHSPHKVLQQSFAALHTVQPVSATSFAFTSNSFAGAGPGGANTSSSLHQDPTVASSLTGGAARTAAAAGPQRYVLTDVRRVNSGGDDDDEYDARGGGGDDDDGDDDTVFLFEPRREPIDVFLSYLYPVHYNALCVVEVDSDEEGEKPQFINASFLRTSL